MEVEEIKKYILDIQVLSKEVLEGYSNRKIKQEERVLLLSSESKVEGEKDNIFYLLHSFYDIMELEPKKQALKYYFDFSKGILLSAKK